MTKISLQKCRMRGDIIDSNVTEGIPSFPPVESMVTAYHAESKVTDCHAMRGTRSSGDDIREGDAILEVAMDDDEDLYAGRRKRGDIIDSSDVTEGIPSLSPVEFMETAYHADSKVTDCHAMRGTRSSGDDIREGDAILEVAMDDDEDWYAGCRTRGIPSLPKVELKGFQHLFKSTKTTSSLRVLAAHKATKKHGVPRNYYARRRDRKKNTKIHDVEKVKPSPENMMNMRNDPSSKAVFLLQWNF